MFILVSYSNDPHIQDMFYHGKFETISDVRNELEYWADIYFDKRQAMIDYIPLSPNAPYNWCDEDCFTIDIRYDDNDNRVYGVMGYHDDFRLTFCIAEV